jgi:2-keto-3-deoxy-L-rhamnonate aldolase RhmA
LHFDGVFIDCEHGPSNWQEVEDMVRAADLAGYSSVVRVDRNDGPTITRGTVARAASRCRT